MVIYVLINKDSTKFINFRDNLINFKDFENHLNNTIVDNEKICLPDTIQNDKLWEGNFNNVNCNDLTEFNKFNYKILIVELGI